MHRRIGFLFVFINFIFLINQVAVSENGKLLRPVSVDRLQNEKSAPVVFNGGFVSSRCDRNILNLDREKPWMLPKLSATMAEPIDTIKILALRFDFVYEIPDDSNTTGRGQFDMRDTLAYFEDYGHLIDPSPHNRSYFEKHLEALNNYYYHISDSNLILQWVVYPTNQNEVYHLPNNMAHYGYGTTSEEIIRNLVDSFFIDCFQLVDSTESEIIFADYDAYILFHAGSDRQNDIGFPPTQSDLFTGFVRRGDDRPPLRVDDNTFTVSDAIIMPEMASQDNRATALNAVMAHEFGHQLGLVDLYRTDNFFTQVGDFALMDNNGFGTGVDLGFERVGRVFGTMPVYPDAWSRAYLGFVRPTVFRQAADVNLVASEMISSGVRIARIPITEYEYYLLENRQIDIDNRGDPALLADSATSVILGPVYYNPLDESKTFTNEYDFLLPGSGIIIWHVDESVASMTLLGENYNLFETNRVQTDIHHRFIEIMEADGLIDFGGNYYSGFGRHEDMYYAGNNSSFTPNTNPPSEGYGGSNSHIGITDISASGTIMTFNLDYDLQSEGFPRRAGYPFIGFSPIAADINADGSEEIIAVSSRNILIIDENGGGWYESSSHTPFFDTSYNSVGETADSVPIFARTPKNITTGPVFGDFGIGTDTVIRFIAAGAYDSLFAFSLNDENDDGRADRLFNPVPFAGGTIVWASFDTVLYTAVYQAGSIHLYSINAAGMLTPLDNIDEDTPYGFARAGNSIVAIAGDTSTYANLYMITPDTQYMYDLNGYFEYGPVTVDLDRDDTLEVVVATPGGIVKVVSLDPTSDDLPFTEVTEYNLGDSIFANPIIADIDIDGYADIILCGRNKIQALDRNLISLTNFPITIDRRFADLLAVSPPVVADIDNDNRQDIILAASNGNCYALGPDPLYGFPLPIGSNGQSSILLNGSDLGDAGYKNIESNAYGSPLVYKKSTGGGLGYLGGDGWFYSWNISYNSSLAHWPMYAGHSSGINYFPEDRLVDPVNFTDKFSESQFYCYPNPTVDGRTTIRYFLGEAAEITLSFYDMIGDLVSSQNMTGLGGVANEYLWDGSFLPSGVYRCIIKADFSGDEIFSFIDIAIVK